MYRLEFSSGKFEFVRSNPDMKLEDVGIVAFDKPPLVLTLVGTIRIMDTFAAVSLIFERSTKYFRPRQ